MSHVTELATVQLTATDTLTIELVEANETPAVVIIRWPGKCIDPAPATLPGCCRCRCPHLRRRRGEAGPTEAGAKAVTIARREAIATGLWPHTSRTDPSNSADWFYRSESRDAARSHVHGPQWRGLFLSTPSVCSCGLPLVLIVHPFVTSV
jgi:hypothetical protein